MSKTINKYTYATNAASKKLLYERVDGLHYYIAEDFDEEYLIKKHIQKATPPCTFILKDARGRLLAKFEVHNGVY